jgi:ABC-2 type transport system ATP-binding protein
VLLERGRITAKGTPAELKARYGGERIEVAVADVGQLQPAQAALESFADGACSSDEQQLLLTVPVRTDTRLVEVVRALDEAGVDAKDVHRREATLDDVFLSITHSPHAQEALVS